MLGLRWCVHVQCVRVRGIYEAGDNRNWGKAN